VNDLPTHLLLFVLISAAIVLMSAFFSEHRDGAALRAFPKRLVVFIIGCGVLTAIMLVFEHTFAAV